MRSACVQPLSGARSKMPVVKGRITGKILNVLRDTGSSGIVKRKLVIEEQCTDGFSFMLLIDNTVKKVPIARITVDTPTCLARLRFNAFLMQSTT